MSATFDLPFAFYGRAIASVCVCEVGRGEGREGEEEEKVEEGRVFSAARRIFRMSFGFEKTTP